jgi:hypothetical protein
VLASILPCPAAAEEKPAGVVKLAYGTASVVRGGNEMSATPGLRLLEKDVLKTAEGASMGVILRDDTLVALGAGTTVAIARFAFAPENEDLALDLRVTSGKIVMHSGGIARISPKAVRLETPTMIVGVRGTTMAVAVN